MISARDRLELNQQLFREVNGKLRELAIHQFNAPWTGRTKYLCECRDQGCVEIIELTLDEYEGLRAEDDLRAVVPGHESPGWDVIARTERFHLVSCEDVSPAA
jgi:hypothetical protein